MEEKIGEALALKFGFRSLFSKRRFDARRAGTSVLMNPSRQKTFRYLCQRPCSHLREISRNMRLSPPAVEWHLDKLAKAGFVSSAISGKKKLYYPSHMLSQDDIKIIAVLNDELNNFICKLLINNPGLRQNELCRETGIYQQRLFWHLDQIEKAGLLRKSKCGKGARYTLTEKLSEVRRKSEAMAKIQGDPARESGEGRCEAKADEGR